jgi:hypothetical protein
MRQIELVSIATVVEIVIHPEVPFNAPGAVFGAIKARGFCRHRLFTRACAKNYDRDISSCGRVICMAKKSHRRRERDVDSGGGHARPESNCHGPGL